MIFLFFKSMQNPNIQASCAFVQSKILPVLIIGTKQTKLNMKKFLS